MELKDFIRDSLIEIAEGVEAAQNHSRLGGQIAPSNIGGHDFSGNRGVANNSRITSTVIQFDIAVSVDTKLSAKAETKGKIFVAEAGGNIEGHRSSNEITRMQFSVPFIFPANKKTWDE